MSIIQARKTKLLMSATAVAVFIGLTLAVAPSTAVAPDQKQTTAKKTQTTQKKTTPAKTKKKKTVTRKATSTKRVKKTSRSRVRTETYTPPANEKPRPANGQRKCESWEDWTTPCGKNQRIGYAQASDRGWTGRQWVCLKKLWYRESGWSKNSGSPNGGAFGIPQALPGSKMASAGSDWRTNAATQIKWGLGYIDGRYGSPCSAYAHWQSHNWY
jgi:hypothetical protein